MATRPLRRLEKKRVMHSEDVEAAISHIMTTMEQAKAEFRAHWESSDSEASHRAPMPDISELAERSLRSYLEDEIVELEPVEDSGIREKEIQREVIKKALVNLKLPALRAVALNRGIPASGKADEIARRVAFSYNWDSSEIAQLILDHNEELTETENGLSTRVFVLREPADFATVEKRLKFASGRYIRVGVARWFVFDRYQRLSETSLELQGSLRTYQPNVEENAGEASLKAVKKLQTARLQVNAESRYIQVHDANVTAAKAVVSALNLIRAGEVLPYVPGAAVEAEVPSRTLHPSTLFLLDLLTHKLRGNLFQQRNPVLARFRLLKTEDREGEVSQSSTRRPRLSAVRFAGDNLLDSPATCRLMWAESRPLVDLTLRVSVSPLGDEQVRAKLPVRVAVENDHVLVATGLGVGDSTRALEVHLSALSAVTEQIDCGVSSERQEKLTEFIETQAASSESEAEARLLDDAEKI